MVEQTGLSDKQLRNYLSNYRKRHLRDINPTTVDNDVKKTTQRPRRGSSNTTSKK